MELSRARFRASAVLSATKMFREIFHLLRSGSCPAERAPPA